MFAALWASVGSAWFGIVIWSDDMSVPAHLWVFWTQQPNTCLSQNDCGNNYIWHPIPVLCASWARPLTPARTVCSERILWISSQIYVVCVSFWFYSHHFPLDKPWIRNFVSLSLTARFVPSTTLTSVVTHTDLINAGHPQHVTPGDCAAESHWTSKRRTTVRFRKLDCGLKPHDDRPYCLLTYWYE